MAASLFLLGCGNQVGRDMPRNTDLAGVLGEDQGKSDAAKSTKLVDDIGLGSTIEGRFDPRIRVYGYILEAKRGAQLKVTLAAEAGADAEGVAAGTPLDTYMAIYGPFESTKKPGKLLVEAEDGEDGSVGAPPVQLSVEQDARYLLAFSSWQDTGKGSYKVSVACAGTDYQCRRPEWTRPCVAGQKYLQGGKVEGDQVWDVCEVILLEETTVVKDSTLTIKPGVVVKGNYLSGSGQGLFGSVRLVVAGTLQAAGTPDSPIAFTALVPERGWGGILLQGPESNLENVVIERANVAVEIASGASASIRDTLLEGVTLANVRSAAGVRATQDVVATFERAVVKGFEAGLHLQNAQQLVVQDSVVRNNSTGVLVEGRDPAGSGQLNIRSDGTAYISMSCYQPPQQPARWRDPVFVHTDIVDNTVYGIHVGGSDVLLQVERCNVINNKGVGVLVNGRAMHPESYIRQSNIHGNGRWQLASAHVAGLLDISWNYWAQISDPELSSSWSFLCAPHPFTFTGFSPVSIAEAGPRLEVLTQSVAQQTWQQQQ